MGEIISYASILVVSVALYFATESIAVFDLGHTGPATFPRMVLIFLGLMSLMSLIQAWWKKSVPPPSGFPSKRQVIFFSLSLAYIAAISFFHYFPSTVIYMVVILWFLNPNTSSSRKELPKILLTAGITVASIYYVFAVKLDVFFP